VIGRCASASFRIGLLADHRDFIPAVASWLARAWPEACDDGASGAAALLRDWAGNAGPPLGLICRDRAMPVGVAGLALGCSPEGDEVLLLEALFVDPAVRGRGAGRALCEAALARAARLGWPALYLYTEAADGFYRRLGWREVGWARFGANPRRLNLFMEARTGEQKESIRC
jgi:GNAT superfamily N-acetyltransferase